MKLTNETNDEPIYEAENGDAGGGPFPPRCREKPHGLPRECKDGSEVLGYVGRFKSKGQTHNWPKLKNKTVDLRFYATEGDTGSDWCQPFDDVDGSKDYKLEGSGCGNYTLTPA